MFKKIKEFLGVRNSLQQEILNLKGRIHILLDSDRCQAKKIAQKDTEIMLLNRRYRNAKQALDKAVAELEDIKKAKQQEKDSYDFILKVRMWNQDREVQSIEDFAKSHNIRDEKAAKILKDFKYTDMKRKKGIWTEFDKERLVKLHLNAGLSFRQIGRIYGISHQRAMKIYENQVIKKENNIQEIVK